MPYEYLEEMSIADTAFRAWGDSEEEMFSAAADAMMGVMVDDLDSIEGAVERRIEVEHEDLDLLLFNFLQEFLFYKDAECLLLRPHRISIVQRPNALLLDAQARGEAIDPRKHELRVDVKAVTLHKFEAKRVGELWEAFVIVDV